jgi:hypothetical protein
VNARLADASARNTRPRPDMEFGRV